MSYFSIRTLAFALAGLVAFILLLPDAALFPLLGVGAGLIGVWLLGISVLGGVAVIALGVGLIAWGIAIQIKDRRNADDEAEKAQQEAARRFRM